MRTVLWTGLRAATPRLLATGLAVILSVGFVVATLTLSATFNRTTADALTADMSNADVRITPTIAMVATSDPRTSTDVLTKVLPTVQKLPEVAGADVERTAYVDLEVGNERTAAQATSLLDESVRWLSLASGRWPQATNEATLDSSAARSLNLGIGDTAGISPSGVATEPSPITIVGITSAANAGVGSGAPVMVMTPEALDDPALFAMSTGILISGDGMSPAKLAQTVSASVANTSGIVVQTAGQAIAYQTSQLSGSGAILTSILLAFAVVALFVASIVIANTFQVLVAQRTKELALLRCIGSSSGQVRRLILTEAAFLGAVASAIGVAAGLGGAQLLAHVSRSGGSALQLGALAIDPSQLLIGWGVGVLLTVTSALSPAQRATQVRPIAALRATDAVVPARQGVVRVAISFVLIGAGAAGLVAGSTRWGLALAVASGIVSFLGVLLASGTIVPWIVRCVGLLVSWTSVPARLASLNATRNPSRTGSTAAALLVGVTLVTMMVVGVTSVRTSINDRIDEKRPVDLTVQTLDPRGMSAEEVQQISALPDVVVSTTVERSALTIASADGSPFPVSALGVEPGLSQDVARWRVTVPEAGWVLLNADNAGKLRTGSVVTVSGSASSVELRVKVAATTSAKQAMLTSADLGALASAPLITQVQLRLPDTVSALQVQQVSTQILSLSDQLTVGGGAPERKYYEQILDVMLLIVLSLLAIAVVIAVVGVANTLSLSVIERRRESALLRALGLSRGQLRRMLGTEAVLITVVAAVCGIGLGIVYAWAGLSAVSIEAQKLALGVDLPVDQLGVVLAGAVVAGLAASIVPAHDAANRSPIRGLAGR